MSDPSRRKVLGIDEQFASLGDSAHGGGLSAGMRSAILAAGVIATLEMRTGIDGS